MTLPRFRLARPMNALPVSIILCALTVGCSGDAALQPAAPNPQPALNAQPPDTAPAIQQDQPAAVQETTKPDKASATEKPTANEGAATAGKLPGKVKFKIDGETTAYSLKPKDNGAKLVDGDEKELARLTIDKNKLKVKDANDRVLGYIVAVEGRFKVEDGEQKEMFELQPSGNGDWKFKSADEKLIYRLKKRDYGYEIEQPDDKSLYKIKEKSGKISIRDASDKTILYTKDGLSPLAVAPLALDAIKSVPLRAGLTTALAVKLGGVK